MTVDDPTSGSLGVNDPDAEDIVFGVTAGGGGAGAAMEEENIPNLSLIHI